MAQATSSTNKTDKVANRPVHTIRYGAVRAAIWRNMIDAGNASRPIYNVTFSRSYKDGDQWKETASFGADDLLVLAKTANDAHTYICGQKRSENETSQKT
jgi:hypothetical protein